MTNQQILEKAIKKAIDGGWKAPWGDGKWYPQEYSVNDIIFNHDFAVAFWGDGRIITTPSMFGKLTRVHMGLPVVKPEPSTKEALIVKGWHYHLQQMVVAVDPIQYLGGNI